MECWGKQNADEPGKVERGRIMCEYQGKRIWNGNKVGDSEKVNV